MESLFLASIVEYSDDAIIGKGLDGSILSWNTGAQKMYGFSAEEAIGQSILIVVPPDRQDEVPNILDRISKAETVEHYETKRMAKNGQQIHVSVTVSPIKNQAGEIIGASSVARDIGDRKRADEALQRATAYSRSLIEASLDPLVTVSAEGKVTDVNSATERVTGLSRNELIGTDFVYYFTDPEKARAGYQQAFREGSVRDYELEIRHNNGALTPVMYNASVYRDESGQVIGLFAAARDITERKRADDAVKKSQVLLNEAQQIAHIGSWELDIVNNVLTWSDEIYRLFEIDPAKFGASYEAFLDVIHPDDRKAVDFAYTNSVKTQTPYAIDHRLRFSDGRIKHVHEQCETHYNADGKPLRSFGTVQDITEHKRAEERLHLLNFALDNVSEAAFLIDKNARFRFVNEAACRVLGYTRSELLGLGVSDVDADFPKDRWNSHWNDLKAQGSLTIEGRHKARDGRIFPVEINANYFEYGGQGYNLGMVRDITERKRSEEALSRLNRQLQAVSNCNQVLLRALDEQALVNDICRIICDETGYRLAWVGYAENDDAKTIRPVAWAGVDSGYVADAKLSWADDTERGRGPAGTAIRSGETVCVQDFDTDPVFGPWRESALQRGYRSGIVLPVKDESAKVFGVLMLYHSEPNVTTSDEIQLMEELAGDLAFGINTLRTRAERKRAEIERERLITELETKNAELERFTYSVSHDLKSPLITIRTFLGFVAENLAAGNTENVTSDLDRIDKAAERMGQLLDEILELSRVGRLFDPPSEVPVGDLIHEVLEFLSGRIAQQRLEVQIASDLPVLYVDRPRVLQVFQNLIENSIKFIGDQPQPKIEIGARRDGEETVLFVRDNGMGIQPNYHEKVFGLFDKLNPQAEGTGLGLALVKRIVEVHGGRIWVESEGTGHGSTFYFTLPSFWSLLPNRDYER
ncbi:MAG: PAS domain S-box protein [Desulfomonilaceae bacterium]